MADQWIAAADSGLDKLKELCVNDEGWKADKTKNGVVIHHRYSEDSPIVMMRGSIELPADAKTVLKTTEDLDGRKKWDELFISGKVVQQLDESHQVLHFKFKSPSMVASNRDFVMARSVRENEDGSLSANHVSVEHPDVPAEKGFVRGEIDVSGYYIVPTGENSCKCYYVVQLDPKGWLPTVVVNAVASKQPLVLAKLHKHFS